MRDAIPLGGGTGPDATKATTARPAPATILVADDDKSIRTVLSQALTRQGHYVRATGNGATLWKWVQEGAGDLVITDVLMPDASGLELLPKIRHIRPDLKIIVMSAHNTLMTAVTATERGAFEYLPKPFDLDELGATVQQALAGRQVSPSSAMTFADYGQHQPGAGSNALATTIPADPPSSLPLAGRSPVMQDVYRVIARLVPSDIGILITGESGTGKKLVAKTIHDLGPRRGSKFVSANLASLSTAGVERALFGAPSEVTPGLLSQAQGGTLFLEDVTSWPAATQALLLNLLQTKQFIAADSSAPQPLSARIIAAASTDVEAAIEAGVFRRDLLYRLNEVPLKLPPLSARLDDIPELVSYFLAANASGQAQGNRRHFSEDALRLLHSYRWPGNVRELENFVKRLSILYSQEQIDASLVGKELAAMRQATEQLHRVQKAPSPAGQGMGREVQQSIEPSLRAHEGFADPAWSLSESIEAHLSSYFDSLDGALPPPGLYHRVLRELEKPLFELSLQATRGNQIKTAEILGLNRNTVRKKLRDLEIEVVRGLGKRSR